MSVTSNLTLPSFNQSVVIPEFFLMGKIQNLVPAFVERSTACEVMSYINALLGAFAPINTPTLASFNKRYLFVLASKGLESLICYSHLPYDHFSVQKVVLNFLEYIFGAATRAPNLNSLRSIFYNFPERARSMSPSFNLIPYFINSGLQIYETYSTNEIRNKNYRKDFFKDLQLIENIVKIDNIDSFKQIVERKLLNFDLTSDTSLPKWIYFAVFYEANQILKYLIDVGASVNQSYLNSTPLQLAAERRRTSSLKLLLERQADPNIFEKSQPSPLYFTVQNDHAEAVNLLLKHTANPNEQFNGWTPLQHAAETGKISILKSLLEHNANPNTFEINKPSPLYFATQNNHVEAVNILLKYKANPNRQFNGWTPLQHAAETGKIAILKSLLEHNANPNLFEINNPSPLYFATENNHVEAVNLLLDHQADPNARFNGWTPLQHAAETGKTAIVKSLLEHKANPNLFEKNQVSPLYFAVERNHTQVVDLLLDHNANPNQQFNGWTPLQHAAETGKTAIVKSLLEHQANPNFFGTNTTSPLYFAVERNHTQVIDLLLDHNANPDEKFNGWTPLQMAVSKNNLPVLKSLLEHNANPNFYEKNFPSPLYLAVTNNNFELAKALLAHQIDINTQTKGKFPPLFETIYQKNVDMLKLLMKHNADINVKGQYGYTIMLYAAAFNNSILNELEFLIPKMKELDIEIALIPKKEDLSNPDLKLQLTPIFDSIEKKSHLDPIHFKNLTQKLKVNTLSFLLIFKHRNLVSSFLKAGADINKAFKTCGYFLADYILSAKDPQSVLKTLYSYGFKSREKDGLENDLAFYFGLFLDKVDDDLIQLLIQQMYQEEFKQNSDQQLNLLDYAAKNDDYQRALILIQTGSNPYLHDEEGKYFWDKASKNMQIYLAKSGVSFSAFNSLYEKLKSYLN